jgi:hypothetical protein
MEKGFSEFHDTIYKYKRQSTKCKKSDFIENFAYIGKIVVLFLPMTMQKKHIPESVTKASFEDDDYYVIEKKRIAEETQKAHKIHELEVQSHITSMIPYYEEAEWDDRRQLLLLNNLLINRFERPGMMYWNIFRNAPMEIRDYADLFAPDLTEKDINAIIHFLETKKEEAENMVDMGFDEDGEEDDDIIVFKRAWVEDSQEEEND